MRRAMTHESDQTLLQHRVRDPQLFIRDARHRFTPRTLIAQLLLPVLTDVFLKQMTQQRRDPRRRVRAVRDVTDRHIFDGIARKQFLPKRARNFTVLPAHTVRRTTHANRERRQTVTLAVLTWIDSSEPQKLVFTQPKLFRVFTTERAQHERRVKLIVTSRNRRVCREHALLANDRNRVRHLHLPLANYFACELKRQKRGVSFVQVIDRRRDSELPQQTNTADTEQHLLHDTRLAIAAIEMSRHPAIGF